MLLAARRLTSLIFALGTVLSVAACATGGAGVSLCGFAVAGGTAGGAGGVCAR